MLESNGEETKMPNGTNYMILNSLEKSNFLALKYIIEIPFSAWMILSLYL